MRNGFWNQKSKTGCLVVKQNAHYSVNKDLQLTNMGRTAVPFHCTKKKKHKWRVVLLRQAWQTRMWLQFNSAESYKDIVNLMFSDTKIGIGFKMGKTEIMDTIKLGVALYYRALLLDEIDLYQAVIWKQKLHWSRHHPARSCWRRETRNYLCEASEHVRTRKQNEGAKTRLGAGDVRKSENTDRLCNRECRYCCRMRSSRRPE